MGKGGAAEGGSIARQGDARDPELAPTRRMPSDAVAALWQEELEGLD